MKTYWKTWLFALWLLSQTLGFALPEESNAAGLVFRPHVTWEQSQPGNHGYDDGLPPFRDYNPDLPDVTTGDSGDLIPKLLAAAAYDFARLSPIRVAGTPRAPPVGESGFLAAKTGFDRYAVIRGFQDHHIISDKNALTKSHELLDLAGFDLQSRGNKMFLPSDAALHPTRSIHNGKHWNSVSQNLAEQMDAVVQFGRQNGWSQAQYDQALRAIISQERQLLRSGERALNRNARPGAQ